MSASEVHWRVPVGCGYSGFWTEVVLGYIPALHNRIPIHLLSGKCDDRFLDTHLEPGDATAFRKTWVDEGTLTSKRIKRSIAIEHGDPCQIRNFKANARPRYVIARAMSEANVPLSHAQCIKRLADEVWVPTAWHVERFVAVGVKRSSIRVIPEAVDTAFFDPAQSSSSSSGSPATWWSRLVGHSASASSSSSSTTFTFVSVFKWERRKGWDLLLDAYWQEFTLGTDNVRLVLKTYLPSWEPPPPLEQQVRRYAKRRFGKERSQLPAVELIEQDLPRSGLRELYSKSDAFVLPSRGEGWGLPIAEAMAMGLPSIATHFSGPTAFMTANNSHPLPVATHLPDGSAEPSVDSLRAAMRLAVDERGEKGRLRGEQARHDMETHFSRSAVGPIIVKRLQEVDQLLTARDGGGGGGGGGGVPSGGSQQQQQQQGGQAVPPSLRDELRRRKLRGRELGAISIMSRAAK